MGPDSACTPPSHPPPTFLFFLARRMPLPPYPRLGRSCICAHGTVCTALPCSCTSACALGWEGRTLLHRALSQDGPPVRAPRSHLCTPPPAAVFRLCPHPPQQLTKKTTVGLVDLYSRLQPGVRHGAVERHRRFLTTKCEPGVAGGSDNCDCDLILRVQDVLEEDGSARWPVADPRLPSLPQRYEVQEMLGQGAACGLACACRLASSARAGRARHPSSFLRACACSLCLYLWAWAFGTGHRARVFCRHVRSSGPVPGGGHGGPGCCEGAGVCTSVRGWVCVCTPCMLVHRAFFWHSPLRAPSTLCCVAWVLRFGSCLDMC
jgi:hypothetical protein